MFFKLENGKIVNLSRVKYIHYVQATITEKKHHICFEDEPYGFMDISKNDYERLNGLLFGSKDEVAHAMYFHPWKD